VTSSNSVEQQ